VALITASSFVDYGEVDPYKGPVKHAMQWVENTKVPSSQKVVGSVLTNPIRQKIIFRC